jgi:hypothetical protein
VGAPPLAVAEMIQEADISSKTLVEESLHEMATVARSEWWAELFKILCKYIILLYLYVFQIIRYQFQCMQS